MINVFDQPLMAILSPTEYPSSVQGKEEEQLCGRRGPLDGASAFFFFADVSLSDKSEIGSLFTLFLHAPLLGFCAVSDIGNLEQTNWNQCVAKVNDIEAKITDLLYTHPEIGK
jgi:hypothetical protein